MTEIVVTGRIPEPGLERLRTVGTTWMWEADRPIPPEVAHQQLTDAVASVTLVTDRVDAAFLDAAPKLRIVANVAVGYNNIDVDACNERGITVTNTPGVLTDATADLAMALILMVTRRLGEAERLVRSDTPWRWGMFEMLGHSIRDRRLGIVGMGAIGTELARRARAFGMEIIYHNRRPVPDAVAAELGAARVSFDELISSADVVSLNLPYGADSHHLVNADTLAAMKPSAFLINTGRGPLVDEAALVSALRDGEIAGAGLDVYEFEPEVNPGLIELDNVVLIPHLGSATVEARNAMATLAADNVVAVLSGSAPLTAVDRR